MLTKRHLTIIRGALQFFDEEFSPHSLLMAGPYFDEPLELAADELQELRELLSTVELRYLECDLSGTNIAAQGFLTSDKAQMSTCRSLATVFLISRP